MRLKAITVENVRSFLAPQTLEAGLGVSIIVGPNGGGKTNLFDTIAIALRKFVISSRRIVSDPVEGRPKRRHARDNDEVNRLVLEKHNNARDQDQVISITLEVTQADVAAMADIAGKRERLSEFAKELDIDGWSYKFAIGWDADLPGAGTLVSVKITNGNLAWDEADPKANKYIQYLKNYEIDRMLRQEFGERDLAFPIVYLPTTRTQGGLTTSLELMNFELANQKHSSEAVHSRQSNNPLTYMAVGRLATLHRTMVNIENGSRIEFDKLYEITEITEELERLGYRWSLSCSNELRNTYEIVIEKNGKSFILDQASSGERELLGYVFAIYGNGIKDALILVDEPELHLHPEWQAKMLSMFGRLSEKTGNQFVLATHSPHFINAGSIRGVSRVYSDGNQSYIQPLDGRGLPGAKHLFHLVNAQNNGKIFFSDKIILVEGISDEMFWRAVFEHFGVEKLEQSIELLPTGGKGLFKPYRDLLNSLKIENYIIGDFDYLKQVGSDETKSFFTASAKKIAREVILNGQSVDGQKLVDLFSESMKSGKWEGTQDQWDWILSTRLGPMSALSEENRAIVDRDIEGLRSQGVFVLGSGQLEDYLPEGFAGKDIEKLIEFLATPDFWDRLSADARDEITSIVAAITA